MADVTGVPWGAARPEKEINGRCGGQPGWGCEGHHADGANVHLKGSRAVIQLFQKDALTATENTRVAARRRDGGRGARGPREPVLGRDAVTRLSPQRCNGRGPGAQRSHVLAVTAGRRGEECGNAPDYF